MGHSYMSRVIQLQITIIALQLNTLSHTLGNDHLIPMVWQENLIFFPLFPPFFIALPTTKTTIFSLYLNEKLLKKQDFHQECWQNGITELSKASCFVIILPVARWSYHFSNFQIRGWGACISGSGCI